jgi:hypothetical protein
MFSLKWLNWSLESPRSISLKISKVGQGIFAKRPFSTSRSSTGLTLTWEISNESRKQQEIDSEAPTSYTTSKCFWFQDHFLSFLGFQYVSQLNEPDYPSPFVEPHKPSPGASAPWGQARRQHGCATYHNDWWWKGWVRMGKWLRLNFCGLSSEVPQLPSEMGKTRSIRAAWRSTGWTPLFWGLVFQTACWMPR